MEGNVQPAPQSLSNFTLVEWDGGGGAESSEFLMQTGVMAAASFGSGDVPMKGTHGPTKMLASAKKKTAKNAEKKAKAKPPAARRRKRKTIQGRPRQDNTPHPDALDSMSSLAANVISCEVGGNSAPGGTSFVSAYVGVSWHSGNRRWQAQLSMGKKKFHLGCFTSEHTAARAYDAGIVKHCLHRALNFPDEQAEHGNVASASAETLRVKRRKTLSVGAKTSRFTGTSWHKGNSRWMARITLPGGKRKALGYFDDERSAALAYDRAVVEHNLNLKRLNFAPAPQVVVSAAARPIGSAYAWTPATA